MLIRYIVLINESLIIKLAVLVFRFMNLFFKKLQKVREEVSLDVKFDVRHQKRIFFLSGTENNNFCWTRPLEQRFVIFTFLEYLLSVNTTEK